MCPHCGRPLPTSLLDPAFYLSGDPGLDDHDARFVRDIRSLLLRGLNLGRAHRERLVELYRERHALNERRYRARVAEAADA